MHLLAPAIAAVAATVPVPAFAAASGLAGAWTVDLSAKPDKPYSKEMVLALNADGTVTGTFYDSEITAGRWKTDRGRTCASFRTTDGVGPYHSAVCVNPSGDVAIGQTWAEQRNFLFNWNATRNAGGE